MQHNRHPWLNLAGLQSWAVLVAGGLGACSGPEHNCASIHLAERFSPLSVAARNETLRYLDLWREKVGEDSLSALMDRVPMERVVAAAAAPDETDASMRAQGPEAYNRYYSDSAYAVRAVLHFRHDSLVGRPLLPPRPSELEWYAENCYRGIAR